MLAPKYELDNLICFVDANGAQNDGYVKDILDLGDLQLKIKSFGWETYSIDGNDLDEISSTMVSLKRNGKPICVILNTKKGKGVSFMGSPTWHAKVPSKEEYLNALLELGDESNS
jgi:transketolase